MWNYENVFRKLRNNEQGRYSVTRPYEAKQITDIISNILYTKFHKLNHDCIITDCTAGTGGDTISFSFLFKQVNAIEILCDQFELLSFNRDKMMSLCSSVADRIKLYNCNFMDIIFDRVQQDVIYIDPPWGGIGYKVTPNLKIYIGDDELKEVAKKLVALAVPVFIKLPLNADLTDINISNKFIINNKKDNPSFFLIGLNY
jgi:16S rRNA G966 N2-methylase RsmD